MLANEVDRTIAQNPDYVQKLWSVEYYIINYLFSVGDNEAAMTRLKRSALQGNNKAQLYFESLNLSATSPASPAKTPKVQYMLYW